MTRMLFAPFDLTNWLVLGFTSWLAALGEGGGGSFNFNFPSERGGGGGDAARAAMEKARDWLREWWPVVLGAGLAVLVILVAMNLVFLWLRSRGKFVFLDNIVHRRRLIAQPWQQYRRSGNSLFVWSLAFGVVVTIVVLLLGGGLVGAVLMIRQATSRAAGILLAVFVGLLLVAVLFAAGLVGFLLNRLVVPIMHRFECGATEGWRRLLAAMRGRVGSFMLFALLFFALSMGVGMVAALVTILTCCLCCLACVPLVNGYAAAVVFLPLMVFLRAYGVAFLSQIIPEVRLEGDAPPA
jgi:hypothetical protein